MQCLKSRIRPTVFHVCCACAALAAVWLTPGSALAQSTGLGQSRNSGTSGLAPQRMGSSSGTGLSSQGSGLGSGGGTSGGLGGSTGSGSNGIGLRGLNGASAGSGTGSGSAAGAAGSRAGSSMTMPGTHRTKPKKLALKPASQVDADSSATHSQYDYNYGAEDIGRNADSIYKSRAPAAPTDNYKFGATNPR
jgi:hypothetical protein